MLLLTAAAAVSACHEVGPAVFITGIEGPDKRRKPDGVAIDPVSAPPAAVDRANAEDGLVTLRTPLGIEAARAVVADLFRRIAREDNEGMAELFTGDAPAIIPSSSSQSTLQAKEWWLQRFRRLEYTKLLGEQVARESEYEIYRSEDGTEVASHPSIQTNALGDSDVVIRVPILTSRVGQDRLLGEEMVLWLRRDGDRYRIYRVLEDFQIP